MNANDQELDTMIGDIFNLVMMLAMLMMFSQLTRLMPETATGSDEHSELPSTAQIGQTYWNPQTRELYIYLPNVITPRTEVG